MKVPSQIVHDSLSICASNIHQKSIRGDSFHLLFREKYNIQSHNIS